VTTAVTSSFSADVVVAEPSRGIVSLDCLLIASVDATASPPLTEEGMLRKLL
jgi:hypothetical protein